MIDLRPLLGDAANLLREMDAQFAVIGGLAMGVRAEPRFTKDVDFVVSVPNDQEAERIGRHFINCGYRLVFEFDRKDRARFATGRFAAPLQYGRSEDPILVDLLFNAIGIEQEIVEQASMASVFKDCDLPVADVPHLIAMKTLSANPRRMQDYTDLSWLIRDAGETDLEHARKMVRLIQERGYDSGQDLPVKLEGFIAQWKGPWDGGPFISR